MIATGAPTPCGEFCEIAFGHVGLDWQEHVVLDERFMRPAEVDLLIGDAAKAHDALGWKPETSFEELVAMMVDADLAALQEDPPPGRAGRRDPSFLILSRDDRGARPREGARDRAMSEAQGYSPIFDPDAAGPCEGGHRRDRACPHRRDDRALG